jgi:hypothetical protein
LAYRLAKASGGVDAVTGEEIEISRVKWMEEVSITADQALAAASPATKGKATAGVVMFLLDMLAGGPVLRNIIHERGKERGFTEDQLRRAKNKAGIEAVKEPGKQHGPWFWAKPEHAADWQKATAEDAEGYS